MLFGVRWGRDLAVLHMVYQMQDPMNSTRQFIGFDTFERFTSVTSQDGHDQAVVAGACSVTKDHGLHLAQVLAAGPQLGTYSHLQHANCTRAMLPSA
jgi:hypothetical protein